MQLVTFFAELAADMRLANVIIERPPSPWRNTEHLGILTRHVLDELRRESLQS